MQNQTTREHIGLMALAGLVVIAIAFGMPAEQLTQNLFKTAVIAVGLVIAYTIQASGTSFDWKKAGLPIFIVAGLMTLYSMVSILWSNSWMGLEAAGRWSMIAFVALYVAANRDEKTPKVMLAALWAGAALASATGAMQFLTGWSWIDQAVAPSSTFANRNIAVEYMVVVLPVGVYFALKEENERRRSLQAAAVGLVLAFTIMGGSRAVYTAMLVMAGVAFVIGRSPMATDKRGIASLLLTAGSVCTALLVIPSFAVGTDFAGKTGFEWAWHRLMQTGVDLSLPTSSLGLRAQMWKATIAMIADAPFIGIGAGAWEVEVPRYLVMPTLLEPDYFAHSEPLQLVAEYGLVGWVVFLSFNWWLGAKVVAAIKHADRQSSGSEKACLIGLVGLLVVSLAGFPLHQAGTVVAFGVFLGLLSRKEAVIAHLPHLAFDGQRLIKISLVVWVAALAVMHTAAAAGEGALIALRRADPASALGSEASSAEWSKEAAEMALFQLTNRPWFEHMNRVQIPPLANSLARAGHYEHALKLWEGVAKTRPHLVALKCVLMKASAATGDMGRALQIYTDPKARPCQLDFDARGGELATES